ncbi:putative membrane protein [Arthrobacter roseus]|nr:putative membrane protein [Arthrobacter roseus]
MQKSKNADIKNMSLDEQITYSMNDDVMFCRDLAGNPYTDPIVLDMLVTHHDTDVLVKVAINSNTTSWTLDKLSKIRNCPDLHRALASSPRLESYTASRLSHSPDDVTRLIMSEKMRTSKNADIKNMSLDEQITYSMNDDVMFCRDLAGNPYTDPIVLDMLVTHHDTDVLVKVAINSNTTSWTLDKLSKIRNCPDLHRALASSRYLAPYTASRLSHSADDVTRSIMRENPSLPEDDLRRLISER